MRVPARTSGALPIKVPARHELNGPWPNVAVPSDAVIQQLAERIRDPRRRCGTSEPGPEVQIQHFACHCDTGFDDPADYELELSSDDGDSQRVILGELNLAFSAVRADADPPVRRLVFLNTCSSAHQDPRRVYCRRNGSCKPVTAVSGVYLVCVPARWPKPPRRPAHGGHRPRSYGSRASACWFSLLPS
jgi:hypothetical protein